MFKQCKETVALLLARPSLCAELIDPFVAGIASDFGIEASSHAVMDKLHAFLRMALGGRVEMRRWFTYVDQADSLVKMWHVLLLALFAGELFDGQDLS